MKQIYLIYKMKSILLENTTIMNRFNLSEDFFNYNIYRFKNESYQLRKDNDDGNRGCDVCDIAIIEWAKIYAQYHGQLAIFVCIFGTVANILNIAVLTRKDMACAPINRVLTGLALADMMLMVEYMCFAYYYHVELEQKRNFPFWGAVFILFHLHFSQVLHTISICLTLALAVWRYLAIGYPERNHILCSERRCTLAISLSYVLPLILCSPTYFTFKIKSTIVRENNTDHTLYHTSLSDVASGDGYMIFNFWMYAVVIKLIPCVILTIISIWLIRTLYKAKKRKQVLRSYDVCPTKVNFDNNKKKSKAERRADRTTKMLIAVLLLFLITEFPQGIFGLLSGMKGKCFFLKCYQDAGDVMDILALLNGSINFILYCCMNRMFRATFGQLFKHRILSKWAPPSQSDVHTTGVSTGTNTTEM